VEPLIKALESRGGVWIGGTELPGYGNKLRAAAATALGKIGNARAVEALIQTLKDEEWLVRSSAGSALTKIGKPALGALIQALKNENKDIRAESARALRLIGDTTAIEPLAQALRDEDKNVRRNVVESLGQLGWLPRDDAEKAHYLIAKGDQDGLVALGEKAVEPLIWALGYPDHEIRLWAPKVLGEIGDTRAVEPLILHLEGKLPRGHAIWSCPSVASEGAKANTAEALGSIGDARAVDPLIDALGYYIKGISMDDKAAQAEFRAAVRHALQKICRLAVEPLIQALKHEDGVVRSEAAGILEGLGWEPRDDMERAHYLVAKGQLDKLLELEKPPIELLILVLKDWRAEYSVRLRAADALGETRDAMAVEPLIKVLKERGVSIEFKDHVKDALRKIGAPAVEPLIQALKDEDLIFRVEAAVVLGNIDTRRAIEPLAQVLKDGYPFVREKAAEALGSIGDARAVGPLVQALEDKDKDVQKAAVGALGKIGDPMAVEPLIQTFRDKKLPGSVRGQAVEALVKIEGVRVAELLIETLEDESDSVQLPAMGALGTMREARAIEPLIRLLKGERRGIRMCAARTLGEIRDAKAIEPLEQALKDEDKDVREAAKEALDKIRAEVMKR